MEPYRGFKSLKTLNGATAAFIQAKPLLINISYRMLGTRKEAEDIVQDVYVKLCETNFNTLKNPTGWMAKVCTRLCLDFIKSAEQKRLDYVGPWLPEPVSDGILDEEYLDLSASLSTAFLYLLERLTPRERAVYLLREIFDMDYVDVATTLTITESTCRKLLSRAKASIGIDSKREDISEEKQQKIYDGFKHAVTNGDLEPLKRLLSEDVLLVADGGGKVAALNQAIQGENCVAKFIGEELHGYWKGMKWRQEKINGRVGVIISSDDEVHAVITFDYDQFGCLSQIFIVRNPEKLMSIS